MKRSSTFIAVIFSLLALAACGPSTQIAAEPSLEPTPVRTPTMPAHVPLSSTLTGTEGLPWWNDVVFYEIFVRSFYDSNGDGVGDFNGLTEKLDYLNDGDPETTDDLGITGIWLMPIHPSPSYHGYDITDYTAINPDYGTMEDFQTFLEEAHRRGIVVIIDLVLNHSSNEHPWFVNSLDPNSEYRDYYMWMDERPPMSGWHTPDSGETYYYGLFWRGMPDLNYDNPAVTEEMYQISEYWLKDIGVDGFRLDAAKHLIEDGREISNTPATHAWYQGFRQSYKSVNPQAITVGEVWDNSIFVAEYLQGDELDLAFNFDLAGAYVRAAKNGAALPVISVLQRDLGRYLPHQFASFLSNHDQNRVMSQLRNHPKKAKLAAALLLTGPGVPFIYYGEELGMVGIKPDEDIRTPMQWANETHGGFTTGLPWRPANDDYRAKNVDWESDDPGSLMYWYRTLIHLRNQHASLRVGDVDVLDTENKGVFAMLRTSQEETILVVFNLTEEPVQDYILSLGDSPLADGEYAALSLIDETELATMTISGGGVEGYLPLPQLDPYQVLVIQVTVGE